MNTNHIPNVGMTRGYAGDVAGKHACDVELCTRVATHHIDPKNYGSFIPFRPGQRAVAGPMVCEIDAIIFECEMHAFGTRFDDKAPNSDPNAPRWEDTISLAGSRR